MKDAVAIGVREGIDKSTMQEMIQRIVHAIREHGGGSPDPGLYERVERLETKTTRHDAQINAVEPRVDRNELRSIRNRQRIRELEQGRQNPPADDPED